jgi:integrase
MATNRYPGVYQRSGAWAWRAQYTDPLTGERRGRSGGGYSSAKEAGEARHAALLEISSVRPGQDPDVALCAWLQRWVEGHVQTLRPSSASSYRTRVHMICQTSYQKTKVRDLDETDVKHIIAELREQAPSHSTLVGKVRMLSMALDAATYAGIIQRNPAKGIRISRTHERFQATPWSAEEAQQFLRVRRAVGDPLFPLYLTALTTGMRRGELHGLKWVDLDWDAGLLHVRRQRVEVRGVLEETPPKTASSEAPVVLDPVTLDALRAIPRTSEYVFTDPRTGRPYAGMTTFITDFKRACYESAVPTIRFHDLRHTAASLMAKAGIPLSVAMKRMRHWSPAMTEHYTHAALDAEGEAAGLMGSMLSAGF